MLIELEQELKSLTKDEYERVVKSNPTIEEMANAFYSGSQMNMEFAKDRIISLVNSVIRPNERERLIQGLYYRAYLRLASSIEMKNIRFWETVASNCRTLFEILVDLRMISEKKISGDIEKYTEFAEAQKYEYAKKYVNDVNTSKIAPEDKQFYDRANKYIKSIDAKKNYKSVYNKLWRRNNIPDTWTGSNIYENSKKVGLQRLYRYLYSRICWDTHSGITNVAGYGKDYFTNSFALLHKDICGIFMDINGIIIKEFHLDKALPELKIIVDQIKLIPGSVLVQQNIDKVKKQRKQA